MRALTVAFLFAIALNAFGQGNLLDIPQVPIEDRHKMPYYKSSLMGGEDLGATPIGMVNGLVYNSILQSSSLGYEEVIGVTQYDLQSNASIDDRLIGSGDAISAGWIMSLETTPFLDRGTGYNFYDGSVWGEQPYERIESVRCGWPSIAHTGSGLELSITHSGTATPFLMTSRALGTSDAWSEFSLPMDGPSGVIWPRVATSGTDGNTIHVIGISTPIENGGTLFQGQNGALLYYRSQDAGVTWEQSTFPALDSTNFVGFSGDTYAIHARDGVVAFTVFNDLMDTFVMISEDNGDNWEYTPVIDFPVDNYVIDMGLPEDEGEDFNGDGIFQEYFNSDGAGDVHVDQNGLVHVVFGGMYYMDADTVDDNFSYFPGTNGLEYWNQSYGLDSSLTIAYAYDIDESGTLDLEDEIAAYFVNLAGIPSIGSNFDGRLYVSYSAIMENFSSGTQNYRHIYVVQSLDGGNSWNSGTACDLTPDNDFDGLENVFASMNPNVGDTLELIFQRDFEPGLHVRGDLDPVANNDIVSLRVPISWLEACTSFDGCTDAQACNYSPEAIEDNGNCQYLDDCGECGGDNSSCTGCADPAACNYVGSTIDDGTCEYPEEFYDCDGICIDPNACNYMEGVLNDDVLILYEEDFESYSVGEYIGEASSYWTTWSGAIGTDEDGQISDEQAYSGTQSLKVFGSGSAGGPMDLYLPIGLETTYDVSFNLYVPSGYSAYINMQEQLTPGVAWAFDIVFSATGAITLSIDQGDVAYGVYNPNSWNSIHFFMSPEEDIADIIINGEILATIPFDNIIGGLNLFGYGDGTTQALYYIDDLIVSDFPIVDLYNSCTYPEEFLDCDGNCVDLESFEIVGSISPEEFTLNTYSVSPYIENSGYTWLINGGVEYSSGGGQLDVLFASSGMGSVHCEQSQGTCNNSSDLSVVILPSGTPTPENGCTYSTATNFDISATQDDGSCIFDCVSINECAEDLDLDGSVGVPDLLQLLAAFGQTCE